MAKPKVAVVMGSDSDLPKLEGAIETLRSLDIPFTAEVLSAHRTPQAAHDFAANAERRGYRGIIAAAGGVPVATVAIGSGGATNAAVLAAQIPALSDSRLRGKLRAQRRRLALEVAAKSKKVQEEIGA